ncbi:saccharopine dehydrogenase NADP-binding domain-containing protein [Streptomyces pactum]|uniref:Saccharopine dehydrogenase n=1 Tax=Streptomyces pactum TaxID=68249 RepID=A0A1S6J4S6_9ACTN|nr:saccharopine dehydrogenase NADP-binding domain-containing protein [Streptomyces pactum]AQS66746.1 saccharopine dehydrogenase [Streptomyces pactum]
MRDKTAVGVLGGYGAVGGAVVRRLHRAGAGPLLVAGRDADRAAALVTGLPEGGSDAAALAVDLTDPDSLDRFTAGCRLVVNCAGPSYRVLDLVARAALRNGADYVDAAGDDPVRDLLSAGQGAERWAAAGRVAVLSAGALPGLSSLLPRALAARATAAVALDAYVGGVAPLTPAAAGDVLLGRGPEHGTPAAAWEEGRIRERALAPRRAERLDAFPAPVDAFPFLSAEAVRLARDTGVGRLRWYTVFGGGRLAEELAMAWALDGTGTAELVTAADEDVRRHGAWYGQEFHLWDGVEDGPPTARLVLRAEDSYELSGFLAATAALGVLHGAIAPGVRFAAEVLDPLRVTEDLATDGAAELRML